MKTVAIIGVGLIGGSFALALRKAGFEGTILGISGKNTLDEALELGIIDRAANLEDLREADLVYLAQPIFQILERLASIDEYLRPDALVTDAGSTKAAIVKQAALHIRRAQFLGGHPMAGKESRGPAAADPDLFVGRTYVLTPKAPADLDTPAAADLLHWIRRFGADPLTLAPEEHDRVVAYTSHLPQVVSTALASLLAGEGLPENHRRTSGPGLLDCTRLALSPYEVWRDILSTNSVEVRNALSSYIAKLLEIRDALSSEMTSREFAAAAEFARSIRNR